MGYKFSTRSKETLRGVHPDLIGVCYRALQLTEKDFTLVQGVRTAEEQNELYKQGRSKPGSIVTHKDGYKNKSNHQVKADGWGWSVDFAVWNGKIDFNDIDGYKKVASAFLKASKEMGIPVRWGADWNMNGKTSDESFLDWGHVELVK